MKPLIIFFKRSSENINGTPTTTFRIDGVPNSSLFIHFCEHYVILLRTLPLYLHPITLVISPLLIQTGSCFFLKTFSSVPPILYSCKFRFNWQYLYSIVSHKLCNVDQESLSLHFLHSKVSKNRNSSTGIKSLDTLEKGQKIFFREKKDLFPYVTEFLYFHLDKNTGFRREQENEDGAGGGVFVKESVHKSRDLKTLIRDLVLWFRKEITWNFPRKTSLILHYCHLT